MTTEELQAKVDEALAACLDRTKKCAETQESNNARLAAKAAWVLARVRSWLRETP